MCEPFRLSVGDRWRYEKISKEEKVEVKYKVKDREQSGDIELLILDLKEIPEGRDNSSVMGRFWIDGKTDRFVKGERSFCDESGEAVETEFLRRSRLKNWGVKGHARVRNFLEVGDCWRFEDSERLNRASVEGTEEVEVPAGKFECYLIETAVGRDAPEFKFKSWYAKGIGILAKSLSRTPEGKTTGRTELISYFLRNYESGRSEANSRN